MRKNIVFNYVSRLFSALSTFIFTPFYISILGIDGFSVIALSLVVISILLVLDIGLSASIGREMARQDTSGFQRKRAFFALEKVYLALVLLATAIGVSLASTVAWHLIGKTTVSRELISNCLVLIAMEAGLQLLLKFYTSVLIGLERQVEASVFTIAWTALRNGVVIGVIWWTPDLEVFFIWQMASTFVMVIFLKINSIKYTRAWPKIAVPMFDIETLIRLRGFAFGMLLISLVAVLNTQLDKLLISALASLRDLAAYTLAASMATAMLIAATPITTAILPRFTAYFTSGNIDDARALYTKSTQLIAVLILPAAVTIALNAHIVMLAWTGDTALATVGAPLAPYLIGAYVIIALAASAHTMTVANGYTKINNIIGLSSLFLSIPGYFLAVKYEGVVALAQVFFGIQFCSNLLLVRLVMSRFLKGGFWKHALFNYAIPCIAAIAGAVIFRLLWLPPQDGRLITISYLLLCTLFSMFVCWLISSTSWKAMK